MLLKNSELNDETQKLADILNGSPIPTFVIDADCKLTHWNRACELLTNLPASEMIGTDNHRKAFYSEYREVMADLIVKNANTDELDKLYGDKYRSSSLISHGYQGEDFFPHLGDGGMWLFFTCAPLKDTFGRVVGAIETIQDNTSQKAMIQSLRDQKAELDEKSRHLEKVNQALKASLDNREVEKRAVEENLIKNLKRYVIPYLEELERCKINSGGQAYIDIIKTNLNDLISQFSTTLSSKYIDFTPAEVRIADFIRDGKNTKDIANFLGLSPASIKWHRKNIREKLGLTNRKVNLHIYLNSHEK